MANKTWDCPKCGKKALTDKFCGDCGTKKPFFNFFHSKFEGDFCVDCETKKTTPTLLFCEKCKKLIDTKFCETCGKTATEIEIILEEKNSAKSNEYGSDSYYIVKSPDLSDEELKKILGFTMIEKSHKYSNFMRWDNTIREATLSDTDGLTGWRLPSIKELKTVYKILKLCGINDSLSSPMDSDDDPFYDRGFEYYIMKNGECDAATFQRMFNIGFNRASRILDACDYNILPYWSSTTTYSDKAWCVIFTNGSVNNRLKKRYGFKRCVR